MILVLVACIINILRIYISINLFVKSEKYPFSIIMMSILILLLDFVTILSTFISDKFIILAPFTYLINYSKNYSYISIFYLILIFILLLLYKGIEDRFQNFHRILVGIYFMLSSMGYIVLTYIN